MLTDYLRIDSPRCINTISAASRFTLKYICKELTAADSMYKHEKELAKELAEGGLHSPLFWSKIFQYNLKFLLICFFII